MRNYSAEVAFGAGGGVGAGVADGATVDELFPAESVL